MEQTAGSITVSAATSFLRPNHKITGYSNEILGQIATNSGIVFNQGHATIANELVFGQQQNSGIVFNQGHATIANELVFGQQQNSGIVFNQGHATIANELVFGQQQNSGIVFNQGHATIANELVFGQQQNVDSCDFLTLEQFLKEEKSITSIYQLIESDKEIVYEIIKDYFQECYIPLKTSKVFQLILFVFLLTSSIFGQQFGGNRDLPVA